MVFDLQGSWLFVILQQKKYALIQRQNTSTHSWSKNGSWLIFSLGLNPKSMYTASSQLSCIAWVDHGLPK